MAETAPHFDLKIFVDKEKGRVLFAEADGGFVDVLFSFLTLPLGTIVRLIGKTQSEPASTLGYFGSLYQTVAGLGNEHFLSEKFKDMLLNPRSSSQDMCRKLKINIDDTEAKFYICSCYSSYNCPNYMSIYCNAMCPACRGSMSVVRNLGALEGKVFFGKALKFIITDNLQVTPVVPRTFVGYLNNLGNNDSSVMDARTVKLGVNELIELLQAILLSKTPLTDLFVSKTKKAILSTTKKVPSQTTPSSASRKINVKVVLKKSSKEFLFVEAGNDFIDFLFSLLLIPLGKMLHIMEGQSGLGCIDELYKSAQSLDSKHFSSEDYKSNLLRPKLPQHLIYKNHLFPLESTPLSHTIDGTVRTMSVGNLGSGGFVREEEVFIVLDDLTVKPFSAEAAMSIINMHKVAFPDLEERTFSVGVAEGISILRASLNSTSAISNGLLCNSLVFKKPKKEK